MTTFRMNNAWASGANNIASKDRVPEGFFRHGVNVDPLPGGAEVPHQDVVEGIGGAGDRPGAQAGLEPGDLHDPLDLGLGGGVGAHLVLQYGAAAVDLRRRLRRGHGKPCQMLQHLQGCPEEA